MATTILSTSPRGLGVLASAVVLVGLLGPTSVDAQMTRRLSEASAGVEGNDSSFYVDLSADGRFVSFESSATNLVPGDTNGQYDIFVRDRLTGSMERVDVDSTGGEANGFSSESAISADGRIVAFYSSATNLVTGDTNVKDDIFVHDRLTGETTRVSVDSMGNESDGGSGGPAVSADGRFVAFASTATNLVAGGTNAVRDVFVHDRLNGLTTLISVDTVGGPADNHSGAPSLSADGRYVAFHSSATDLVAGDTNGVSDAFVHDRQTGQTLRVSLAPDGSQADRSSNFAVISGDGFHVAYVSLATNLVAADTNGKSDCFVTELATLQAVRVSVGTGGVEGNGLCLEPHLSSDGRRVVFASRATNLVPGDTNGEADAFLHDLDTGETIRLNVDAQGVQANDYAELPRISGDGCLTVFASTASNLVAGDSNGTEDVFEHLAPSVAGTWDDLGGGSAGALGVPVLAGQGALCPDSVVSMDLSNAPPGALMLAWISAAPTPFSALGGTVHAFPFVSQIFIPASGAGTFVGVTTWPAGIPSGASVFFQFIVQDLSVPDGLTLSNGVRATTP